MNGFASALSLLMSGFRAVTTSPGYGIGIWFLAAVFFWSGIVKLRQPTLAAMAMVDFGVAQRVRKTWGSRKDWLKLSWHWRSRLGSCRASPWPLRRSCSGSSRC